jgi:hypothetical protein
VEVTAVSGMTCHIDRLRPKLVRGLVLIKHGSCHLYESSVFSFDHLILLRSIGDQKFMLHDFFIKEVFYLSVLELGVIITSYLLDLGIKLILCPFQELP